MKRAREEKAQPTRGQSEPLPMDRPFTPISPNLPLPNPSPRSAPERNSAAASAPETSFRDVLTKLGQRIDSGEKAIDRAVHAPATASSAELIALQTQVYRYSETLDLAAKVVDKVSSGVKTVMQGQ
jgi:hypothetical protein